MKKQGKRKGDISAAWDSLSNRAIQITFEDVDVVSKMLSDAQKGYIKDFVDFLVDGHTTMTHNEFSLLKDMFKGHLFISTVYNRVELTIYELSIRGVKARVLYNNLQNFHYD